MAIKFGFRGTRYCATSQRAELREVFLAYGQAPDALASRGKDCVADRRRHDWQSRLADAGGIFLAHHHVDFGERSLADAWHAVVVEVGLLDAAILDGNGVMQRGGEAIDCGAFDLRAHPVGIDGPAAIHRIDQAVDFYGAILDAGFRDGGGVGIEGIERGDAASLALWQRLTPASFFGRKRQNAL